MVTCNTEHVQRVVLVTGAGRGIGKEIAEHFAREGAFVGVNSRTEKHAQGVAEGILAKGGNAVAAPGDVSQEQDVRRMVEALNKRWGPVEILINNAAIDRRGAVMELAMADWEEVFRVNVRGPLLCIQATAPAMAKRGWGRIINIGSWVGERPYVRSAPYCSSKAALLQLTRVAALEMARSGVTVNAVCPGSTTTAEKPMDADARQRRIYGDPSELRTPIPMGETATPSDIASMVCYLSGANARHVTGQVIFVDGGQVLV